MTDLVTRLRRWTHAVDAVPASDLMDEAAAEIEALRLTDAEREAVRFCGELCRMGERPDLAATLRGLLERPSPGSYLKSDRLR